MSDTPPYPAGPPAPRTIPAPLPSAYPQPIYPQPVGGGAAPRTPGVIALVVALVAVVGATVLSASASFLAAAGAARRGFAIAPEGLENLSNEQLLALLSPVRGLVLWAEIGFWAGTVLGIAAIVIGIVAIVRHAGRGLGIAAVVVAAVAPFAYGVVVFVAVVLGVTTGANVS